MNRYDNQNFFPLLSKRLPYENGRFLGSDGKSSAENSVDTRFISANSTLSDALNAKKQYIEILNNPDTSKIRLSKDFIVRIPDPDSQDVMSVHKYLYKPRSKSFVVLPQLRYELLFNQVQGGKYGPPERPDIEIFLIGVDARISLPSDTIDKSSGYIIHDESAGNGLEILFHPTTKRFIVSIRTLDQLVLLASNDIDKCVEVTSCKTLFGVYEIDHVDLDRKLLLRRFIMIDIVPLLKDDIFIRKLVGRITRFKAFDSSGETENDFKYDVEEEENEELPKHKISSVKERVSHVKPKGHNTDHRVEHRNDHNK